MYDLMTVRDFVQDAVIAGNFAQARELIRDAGFIPDSCNALLEEVLLAEKAYRLLEGCVVLELCAESAASARHLIETASLPAEHKVFLRQRVLGYEQGPTYFALEWPVAYVADGARIVAQTPWSD